MISAGRSYARAETSYGRGELSLVAPRSLRRAVLAGRPLVERVVAPVGVELPVQQGPEAGRGPRLRRGGGLIARSPLVASRSMSEPGALHRAGWFVGRAGRATHVGLGLDDHHRHAQCRSRSHAHRAQLPARPAAPGKRRRPDPRRRQGHQRRPRAQAARGAGRGHRARGRPHGHAHRRGADRRGDPQRLRPHRRRVAHLDGCRRPDRLRVHGDQRMGAARRAGGARDPARQAALPRERRPDGRLLGLASARASTTTSTRRRSAT